MRDFSIIGILPFMFDSPSVRGTIRQVLWAQIMVGAFGKGIWLSTLGPKGVASFERVTGEESGTGVNSSAGLDGIFPQKLAPPPQ